MSSVISNSRSNLEVSFAQVNAAFFAANQQKGKLFIGKGLSVLDKK